MAFSFDDLKRLRPKLDPVAVSIEGISEPVLLHQFTLNELALLDKQKGDDQEQNVRISVLRFLKGPAAEIGDDDRAALDEIFTAWQLRQIFMAGLKLNGQGPSAVKDAEKN